MVKSTSFSSIRTPLFASPLPDYRPGFVQEHEKGLWGTARGDIEDTKRKEVDKTRESLELMRHHPLTEKLVVSLFTSINVGAFRYSKALTG